MLNANAFLRAGLFGTGVVDPRYYFHHPVIARDSKTLIGQVLNRLKVNPERADDDVIDGDLILVWATEKRVITGVDILGRLLRRIVTRDHDAAPNSM